MVANPPAYQPETVNTCLQGIGIVCGLNVRVKPDCSIHVSEGSAINGEGILLKVKEHNFKSYKKKPNEQLVKFFETGKISNFYELSEVHDGSTDSLKQQSPNDTPTKDLLENKILIMLSDAQTGAQHFVLLRYHDVAEMKQLGEAIRKIKKQVASNIGIFKNEQNKEYLFEDIEKALFPYLQLPKVEVPRFGYKTLAIVDKKLDFGLVNFENPFLKVKNFSSIFFEYKAILDDLIPEFNEALAQLHQLYGNILTDKGGNYWEKYRLALAQKWDTFLEDGEHLYYVQYFYDWLQDLVKAYQELCIALSNYHADCHCEEHNAQKQSSLKTLFLGPVIGAQSSYKSLIFRDYYTPSSTMNNSEDQLRKIKFLHWRMMMMIWTFDLPFLKLDEKVLRNKFKLIRAKEFEDSTNFYEKKALDDVPIKFTPSAAIEQPLENQAIPYYYPVDSDSPFSLHNYWNYQNVKNNLTAFEYSFNTINDIDTYSAERMTNTPIAFSLQQYPFVRVEGAIGRKYSNDTKRIIQDLILNGNICIDVVFINIYQEDYLTKNDATEAEWFKNNFKFLNGLEHKNGANHGQTMVFLYVGTDEQLELNECKKDGDPEIPELTIVADFTLPYRVSLETLNIVNRNIDILELIN
jgi:hypothetical protein